MTRCRLACLVFAASLTACSGSGGNGSGVTPDACSVGAQKTFVQTTASEWYLFPELLPSQVDAGRYATAQDLLDYLTATARAQGKDRYFSYVTTQQADDTFLQEGQFIGFGFRIRVDGNRVFFMEVFENSPAAEAGIVRGDELFAVNGAAVANLLPTDPNLSQAFGPSTEGLVRTLSFASPGDPQPTQADLAKRIVTIRPLPANGVAILDLPSNPSIKVGYVNLRSFITTANAPLAAAFSQFAAAPVPITNFIIDLRYNGGGLISVADGLGDLLGKLRQASDVYAHLRFRASKSSQDVTYFFNPRPESADAVSIAFITTEASASASELTINSMNSWANVAIVGADTYGKPVGQSAFDLSGCDTRLRLVTFRSTNKNEEGDYYDGLAGTLPFACAAADDLGHAMGDPAEASTAEALHWLSTGACSAPIATAPTAQKPGLGPKTRYPVPERPTPAQINLPGLY